MYSHPIKAIKRKRPSEFEDDDDEEMPKKKTVSE